ncbi:MAG TPA: membrane protein insertion efficiency factor YidD [Acetobacteraceae bacterium]
MTQRVTFAAWLGIGAVRVYQWTLRPFIGPNCRFYPSCSEYAVEALRSHGALRGSGLAAWRILRCNPWTAGGYDPVPTCTCRPSSTGRLWTRHVDDLVRHDETGL